MTSFRTLIARTALAFCGVLIAPTAHANDKPVSLSVDAGLANISAEETVYSGGQKISHLDWQSKGVMVLRGALSVDLGPSWTLKAEAKTGMEGNGQMTDYDWIYPYYINGSKNGWSDRSEHGDTDLDHYFSGSLELNRRFYDDGSSQMGAGIGARYTDVQWTAKGGTFVYSVFATRDFRGRFADDERGITYRQKIPVIYANLNGEQTFGRWTVTGSLQAGAMIKAKDVDDHWMRDLRFDEDFSIAPSYGARAGIEYQLTDSIALYVDGSVESTRFGRGDTKMRDTVTGESARFDDAAGGSFSALFAGFGVKGSF